MHKIDLEIKMAEIEERIDAALVKVERIYQILKTSTAHLPFINSPEELDNYLSTSDIDKIKEGLEDMQKRHKQ